MPKKAEDVAKAQQEAFDRVQDRIAKRGRPCPNCGHCPTCGRTPQRYPYPWANPRPYWGPYRDWDNQTIPRRSAWTAINDTGR